MNLRRAARFATTFAAMYSSHMVADHWIQTEYQAKAKGQEDNEGRIACAKHVTTHSLFTLGAILATDRFTNAKLRPGRLAAAMTVHAITHYWADRRKPLRTLAENTGSREFYTLGIPREGKDDNPSLGTGAYALDQSWHIFWIAVSSAIAASGEK